ncbi:MAG TPA: hypothetical protein VMW89_10160 [Desulfatiglandales bacterium]|nr:hypothetical protein [Desulfatiglandales bacterium]
MEYVRNGLVEFMGALALYFRAGTRPSLWIMMLTWLPSSAIFTSTL